MKSFNYQSLNSNASGEESLKDLPDIAINTEYTSLILEPNTNNCAIGGLLLIDENENLKVISKPFYILLYTKIIDVKLNNLFIV